MATKEQQREWAKEWDAKNPEKRKAIRTKYQQANQEAINAKRRAYRAANREKLDAYKRQWEKDNPEILSMQRARKRIKDMNVRQNIQLRHHYDITLDAYNEVLAAQGGVCVICQEFNVTERSNRLVVDHDHESGVLRGLLCHRCNCGLGYFKDNVALVSRAIAYLEGFDGNTEGSWVDRVRRVLARVSEKGRQAVRLAVLGKVA